MGVPSARHGCAENPHAAGFFLRKRAVAFRARFFVSSSARRAQAYSVPKIASPSSTNGIVHGPGSGISAIPSSKNANPITVIAIVLLLFKIHAVYALRSMGGEPTGNPGRSARRQEARTGASKPAGMKRSVLLLMLLALTAVPARASNETLHFRCGGGTVNGVPAIAAMENEYITQAYKNSGACWFHLGHHTYDIGREVELVRLTGSAFSVEQQFSPPTEINDNGFSIIIESSRTGISWQEIARPLYTLGFQRQTVSFDVAAGNRLARYIRIREPKSAMQGLSGYIDSSNFDAEVIDPGETPVIRRPTTMSCQSNIMERFFNEHPCWFGGINRYDSPSVFHTYPLDPGPLASVAGSVTFLPWRSDDYTQNAGSRTAIAGVVQASVDGVSWTKVGNVVGVYGVPITFSFPYSAPANYIRLAAEYHTGASTHPALKHVRGFIVDSSLQLTQVTD